MKRPGLRRRVLGLPPAPTSPGSTSEPEVLRAFHALADRSDGERRAAFANADRADFEREGARIRALRATDRAFDATMAALDLLGSAAHDERGPNGRPN